MIHLGQYSDRGIKAENQDSYGVLLPEPPALDYKGIVMAVADGVSGCDEGKLASESCVKSLLSDYYCTPDSWTVKTSVEKVLLAINRWLYGQCNHELPGHKGLASTLSALVIKSTTAHLFHVGDSRIYRIRGDKLEQLTKDHRFWVSEEKNYLTRAMGIDLNLDIDYSNFLVAAGDVFLMTTDGVHEHVSSESMRQSIQTNWNNLDAAARSISTQALEAGSTDNVTTQIVRIEKIPQADESEIYRKLTELPFPPELSAGMILDGYKVQREIHASKRTQVYLAVDEDTGQKVVLKTPSVNYSDDPTYLDMFLHEEWVGKRLHNNHVLRVVEQTRPRRFFYYVSEYVDGQTLREWISDHPEPPLDMVRSLLQQISLGLLAFHRQEMIHQDLKPENIMIDQHGTVKIIDFGSTKIAGIQEIATPIQRLSLLGTKNYTAPEYLLGLPCSPLSDSFSMAVIAYEMLTGHLPYGESYGEGSIHRLSYVSAREWNADVPVWMDRALKKALSKKPESRYQHLSEFLYDLSHPNEKFMTAESRPLLESHPVGFWKSLAVISLLANLYFIFQ